MAQPALGRVVVHEADGAVGQRGVAQDLAQHEPAPVAGSDDEHVARVLAGPEAAQRPLEHRAHEEAPAAGEREQQQEIERDDAQRRRHRGATDAAVHRDLHRVDEHDVADHGQHGDEDRAHHLLVVAQAEQAPAPLVEPEQEEDDQGAADDRDDGDLEQAVVSHRDALVEPERECEIPGQRDQNAVHQKLGKRVAMDAQGRGRNPSAHSARF